MPIALEKSDRRLLLWVAPILTIIIVVLAVLSPQDEESEIPSTYSSVSSGAKAAYLFLKEEGYNIERWEKSPADLPANPAATVLVLAFPFAPANKLEKNALESYLVSGGKILVTGSAAPFYLPDADVEMEPSPSVLPREYQPQVPSSLTAAGPIKMSPSSYWKSHSSKYLVHYSDEDRPIVVSYKVGKGEVIWWASSRPLTNIGIRESGNLGLLLGSLGNTKSVRILWDEYFHEDQRPLISYIWEPPLFSGLLQFVLIFLVALLTFGRRNGPIRPLYEPSRLSPLEFVHTLGGLYQRAKATETALEVPYNRFRSLLTKRLGMKADTPSAQLAKSARERMGYKDADLEKTLQETEEAFHKVNLMDATALDLVQRLNRHANNLKLISHEEQENMPNADRLKGTDSRTQ
jgi:hypothetical protein